MSSPSINPTDKIIVVFGITGKQGGATAKALLGKGFKVRGITRDVNSSKSKSWTDKGVELVKADLNDKASLEKPFEGAYGVFLVTDHHGAANAELQHGKNTTDAAISKNVKHLVFTSVGNAGAATFPEFSNKYGIEQYIAKKSELTNTVIRPANFFENYSVSNAFEPKDGVLPLANGPDKRIQAVGCRDIGLIAADAFLHPEEYHNQIIELSAEELDGYEMAKALSNATGKKWEAKQMFVFKIGILNLIGHKYGKMAKFWEKPGYQGDVKAMRAKYPWLQTWEEFFKEEYGSQ